jgi:hypothetical protein
MKNKVYSLFLAAFMIFSMSAAANTANDFRPIEAKSTNISNISAETNLVEGVSEIIVNGEAKIVDDLIKLQVNVEQINPSPDDTYAFLNALKSYLKGPPAVIPEIGSIVQFGGIEWRVLDEEDGKILLLSHRIVGAQRHYNSKNTPTTWATSDIRAYLNGEFYNSFNEGDRAKITETNVINNDNPWFGTAGGADTKDHIFLLSLEEVVKYFGDSGQLKNKNPNSSQFINDQYNSNRVAFSPNGISRTWWLRSPGQSSGTAACVYRQFNSPLSGNIAVFGGTIYSNYYGVRPAMWVEI